jgi:hypothetical protein
MTCKVFYVYHKNVFILSRDKIPFQKYDYIVDGNQTFVLEGQVRYITNSFFPHHSHLIFQAQYSCISCLRLYIKNQQVNGNCITHY